MIATPDLRGTELGLWGRLMILSEQDFIQRAQAFDPDLDLPLLVEAFRFASVAHAGQTRASLEPFITHPIAVALQVAELRQGSDAVATALLHDCVEDTSVEQETIVSCFGPRIADIVASLTKLSSLQMPHREARQAEYLRRLLLAVADDVCVIVIKLADRLHNMQTLSSLDPDKRQRIAAETLEIYAPLAHSLGMGRFRTELEDLAFKELDPLSYQEIKRLVSARRREREEAIDKLIETLREILAAQDLTAQITGRAKHFYGIYRKIRREHKTFREIWDLAGIRMVTDSVDACYRGLGLVHASWLPIDGRFKDYIARPKPNMYRSIHTTVRTPEGQVAELQIRTKEMHAIAEYGVAAHWRYHLEQEGGNYSLREHLKWFGDLMDVGESSKDPREILRLFRQGLISNEVMVLTPKGELFPMRAGATALDFAFLLHTDLGLRCNGIRVNGKAVPLDFLLQSGDRVEILTSSTAQPTQDWLTRVTTSNARQKIRRYLSQAERQRQQARGRTTLVKELRKATIILPRTPAAWENMARTMGFPTSGELFIAIGAGKASMSQLLAALGAKDEEEPHEVLPLEKESIARSRKTTRGIRLGALRDLAVRFARCCNPIPGDRIIALITRGRGASIHRHQCVNALTGNPDRWLEVEWDVGQNEMFSTSLFIKAVPKKRVLGELEPVVEEAGAEFKNLHVQTEHDELQIHLQLAVRNTNHLAKIRKAIKAVPGVKRVMRAKTRI